MLRQLITATKSKVVRSANCAFRPVVKPATQRFLHLPSKYSASSLNTQRSVSLVSQKKFSSASKTEKNSMIEAVSLCESAATGDLESIQKMIAAGVDVNSQDYNRRTALHLAAANGKLAVVQLLLDHGAVNQYDRFGTLPIHEAKAGQHYQIEKLLARTQQVITPSWISTAEHKVDPSLHEQMHLVFQLILKEGVFSYSLIASEVCVWFFFK